MERDGGQLLLGRQKVSLSLICTHYIRGFLVMARLLFLMAFTVLVSSCDDQEAEREAETFTPPDHKIVQLGGVSYWLPKYIGWSYPGGKLVRTSEDGETVYYEGGDEIILYSCCRNFEPIYPQAPDITGGNRIIFLDHPYKSRVESVVPPNLGSFPIYNEHFAYVRKFRGNSDKFPDKLNGQETDPSGWVLISREPIYFARHVVVYCGSLCSVYSVSNGLNKRNPPHIFIFHSPPFKPEDKIAYIQNLPEELKRIEGLVTAMQFDPENEEMTR